mgnify:CR=1 FL=1
MNSIVSSIVSCAALHKTYEGLDVAVLNGIDLSVSAGDQIAIVGTSGSGKSTLFKVLSDIKSSESGPTVEMNSTDVNLYGDVLRLIDLPGLYSLNHLAPRRRNYLQFPIAPKN